jgi:hypothetical protein
MSGKRSEMDKPSAPNEYDVLIEQIKTAIHSGQFRAAQYINHELVNTYWLIGKYIIEFEQESKEKAKYGSKLLENLSRDLTIQLGKGFSRSGLNYMRLAYLTYPICEELPHKLTWTHICELVKISDPLERKFYQMQATKEKWSTTELIQKSYQIFCHQISHLKIDLSAFITNQKLNESFFH